MKQITLYEVGLRDGLQNICRYIPLDDKFELVRSLVESGIDHIQLTSFVSPKAIPQMQDSASLTQRCLKAFPSTHFSALVANAKGAQRARDAGLKDISCVVSLSESHNLANVNKTHEESYEQVRTIVEQFPELDICIDLATAFGCPFEGKKDFAAPSAFLKPYYDLGLRCFNLCDTIGISDPKQVRQAIASVKSAYGDARVLIHVHDTRNMGMVNTLVAIESGVDGVQSTLGGLGGCPYAPGASGNLATEDLVFMLQEMGYSLDISIEKLLEAAKKEQVLVPEGLYSGHLLHAGLGRKQD